MQHIGSAIKSFLKKTGLEKGIKEQNVLKIWNKTVGLKISKNTTPVSIKNGILILKVSTPAWRQELQFQKIEIIKKLNKKLNKETIKEIRFKWIQNQKTINIVQKTLRF